VYRSRAEIKREKGMEKTREKARDGGGTEKRAPSSLMAMSPLMEIETPMSPPRMFGYRSEPCESV
jgi:hypothetical protein